VAANSLRITAKAEHNFEDVSPDKTLVEALQLQWHRIVYMTRAESLCHPLISERKPTQIASPSPRAMLAAMTASFPDDPSWANDFTFRMPDNLYDELVFLVAWHDEIMAG
jgi:hypothetical protein